MQNNSSLSVIINYIFFTLFGIISNQNVWPVPTIRVLIPKIICAVAGFCVGDGEVGGVMRLAEPEGQPPPFQQCDDACFSKTRSRARANAQLGDYFFPWNIFL